jgi:hypothetical protein
MSAMFRRPLDIAVGVVVAATIALCGAVPASVLAASACPRPKREMTELGRQHRTASDLYGAPGAGERRWKLGCGAAGLD